MHAKFDTFCSFGGRTWWNVIWQTVTNIKRYRNGKRYRLDRTTSFLFSYRLWGKSNKHTKLTNKIYCLSNSVYVYIYLPFTCLNRIYLYIYTKHFVCLFLFLARSMMSPIQCIICTLMQFKSLLFTQCYSVGLRLQFNSFLLFILSSVFVFEIYIIYT